MIQLIKSIYIETTIAAVIAFILNFRRLDKYFRKQGFHAVFNKEGLVCLIYCFVPILNIFYGMSYLNGAMWTDEQFEEFFNENDLEE